MGFLDEKSILQLGRTCKALKTASNDEEVWRQRLVEMRGDIREDNKGVMDFEGRAERGREFKVK